MPSIDEFTRNIAPGSTIVVRAEVVGMSQASFHQFAAEVVHDQGFDDFDLVKVHRVDQSDELSATIVGLTLKRRANVPRRLWRGAR